MPIILKRHFKYKVKKIKDKWFAYIYVQTSIIPLFKKLCMITADTEPEVVEKTEYWIKHKYSHYVWLDDYLHDIWVSFKSFVKDLKPWVFEGWPNKTWKLAKKYFKKLPCKFEVLKNYEPYMDCGEKHIKQYQLIFIFISDVQWKWKYQWIRFEGCPEISITFFRKWTLRWRWTITEADSLYWEDILEYLYNERKVSDLGKHYFQICGTPDMITIDSYLNKENIKLDSEKNN